MAYWLDWVLIHRTEAELLDLASGLPGAELSVSSDASGIQMFLHVSKA